MRSILNICALVAAFAAFGGFAAAPGRVDYTLRPLFDHAALRAVEVDLTFRGDASGATVLELPNNWGGQEELYHAITALRVISGARLSDGADPAHRVLNYRPRALVHIRYLVFQDWSGEPRAENGNPYRPIVQPQYFHLLGSAFLAIPRLGDRALAYVHVADLPPGWSFASDLQHRGLVLGHANTSVTVAGDYRVVHGRDDHIRVAMRGRWLFTDSAFADVVTDIISAERSFWGDASTPYLVTVTPLVSPTSTWVSIGGTGLGDAFAFYASPNASFERITRTLAHEGIHTWIPAAIGGMPDEEAQDYWFSEGMTDFYTGRLMVRGGLWTPAQFAADLNQMLMAYAASPVRTAANSRVIADFWKDEAVQKLPYQRGRLLATIWDARLRTTPQHHDMNWVVLEMRRRASAGTDLHAAPLFEAVMREQGADVSGDVVGHIEHGAPILLDANIFAPCGGVITRDVPEFSRGFDINATTAHNNVISGVDPALPAYAAGLRNGMVLVGRDGGAIGDSQQEIVYLVRDGDVERTIRYMPQGHGRITLQQLVLDNDLTGDKLAQCARVISGA